MSNDVSYETLENDKGKLNNLHGYTSSKHISAKVCEWRPNCYIVRKQHYTRTEQLENC